MYETPFPLPAWFLSEHDHPVGAVALQGPPAADSSQETLVCFPLFAAERLAWRFAGVNRTESPVAVSTPAELRELLAARLEPGYTHVAYIGRELGPPTRVKRLADAIRKLGGQ